MSCVTPAEFEALPPAEQRARIRAAGRRDRDGLSNEHLATLEEADRKADVIAATLPPSEVVDRRTRPQRAI